MNVRYQIFIIVIIIYSSYVVLADVSDNCNCDILHISGGSFGDQNFTKQINNHNGKSVYFSTQLDMISWNYQKNHWSYEKYNQKLEMFELWSNYGKKGFSFANMCEKVTWKGQRDNPSTWIHSQCLIDDSNCSFTKKLTRRI